MRRSRSVFVEMIPICIFITILVVNAFFTGCERRDPNNVNRFEDNTDFVLLIAIDADYVEQDAKPYEFCVAALSSYFSEREGATSQVIFSQLGSDKPVLWQGNPKHFAEEFPSPSAFQAYLTREKKPVTKDVNESISFSLEFLCRHPSVRSKSAKSVALIISRMDSPARSPSTQDEAVNAIIRYSEIGGAIGFYFVDTARMKYVEDELLRRAGIPMFTLQSDVYGNPPLPNWD